MVSLDIQCCHRTEIATLCLCVSLDIHCCHRTEIAGPVWSVVAVVAVGETVILLQPPPPSVVVSIWISKIPYVDF